MFCEKCGRRIPDSSTFCPFCGMKTRPVSHAPETKKKNHTAFIVLAAAGGTVLLLLGVILFLFRDRIFPEGGAIIAGQSEEEDRDSGKNDRDEEDTEEPDPREETEEEDRTESEGSEDQETEKAETAAPEKNPEETTAPDKTPEETTAPEPAEEDTLAPEPAKEDTAAPDSPAPEETAETLGPIIAAELAADPKTEYMYLDMADDGSGWFTVYYLIRNTGTNTFDCVNIRGKTVASPAYENAKSLVDHAFQDPEGVYLPLTGRRAAIIWLSPYGVCAYTHTREEYLNGSTANLKYMLNEAEIDRTFREWGLDTSVTPIPESFREN